MKVRSNLEKQLHSQRCEYEKVWRKELLKTNF